MMKMFITIMSALVLTFVMGLYTAGYRLNLTHSYPLGFYQLSKTNQYQQGDLVAFCPPPSATIEQALKREYLKYGTCKSGSTPLIKKIMAISGDHLSFDGVVRKNGKPLARFLVHSADSHHRELPHLKAFTLTDDEFFMMSDYAPENSFDSRYFGAIPKSAIQGKTVPIFTF
ncbi:TPA: conjugative transfer signal peptidase TraF [Vibrio parahaemolyticus]|nr:conjugative transfer signal peptidase TraF [Vibrio parahaemolyticus]